MKPKYGIVRTVMAPTSGLTAYRTGSSWGRTLRFLAIFGVLLGSFYAGVLLPWCDRAFYRYLQANAWLANGMLQVLGQETRLDGVTIRSVHFAMSVRRGCDGLEPAWFFCAAVLAFPCPWNRKTGGLLLGAAALLALNLVRIVSLYFIGCRLPGFYAAAHLEVWPAVFVLVAVALWIVWIKSALATVRANSHVTV
jgi:exosortase H (IPTLxxWG-CTERM-specific)